jgi:predicted CopG family antitoxin
VLYKNICISERNYKALKMMGQTGDSFNDVLTDLLTKLLGPKFNEEILIGNRHVPVITRIEKYIIVR